jgi:hypothetical protein
MLVELLSFDWEFNFWGQFGFSSIRWVRLDEVGHVSLLKEQLLSVKAATWSQRHGCTYWQGLEAVNTLYQSSQGRMTPIHGFVVNRTVISEVLIYCIRDFRAIENSWTQLRARRVVRDICFAQCHADIGDKEEVLGLKALNKPLEDWALGPERKPALSLAVFLDGSNHHRYHTENNANDLQSAHCSRGMMMDERG